MSATTSLKQSAEFFKALADETRLRCLSLLASEDELCVCEFTHALELSQPKVSRHLAYLKHAGIVTDRRDKLWVYYQLDTHLPDWQRQLIAATCSALAQQESMTHALQRLQQMSCRPEKNCCTEWIPGTTP